MSIAGWIVIAAIVLLLIFAIAIYNRLVRLRALVREAFSGITVQLRRRADLVPNLVETVKGYAGHERETLDAIIAHRGDAVRASSVQGTAAADAAFTGLLGRVMAVAEAYPDLKADENFRQLSTELSELEDELQASRRYYNATVRDLNTSVQTFPNVLVAGPMGFREEPSYEDADQAIQTAPGVSFARPAA
jgi:LemA protein